MPKRVPDTSDLKPNQDASLFPSFGYFDSKHGIWKALVHGRVYAAGKPAWSTRVMLKGLEKALDAKPEDLESPIFKERIGGFLARPGRKRSIVVEIEKNHYLLKRKTLRNGCFYGVVDLPNKPHQDLSHVAAMNLVRPGSKPALPQTEGAVFFLKSHGISIISDIDDTIKMTEATSKKNMLVNTFLKPFEVVEGMSDLYQQWRAQGCDFHYVSSSPWQLYQPLANLCEASQFPLGSMHLRYFRVRDEMFKRFRPLRNNKKVGIIADILKRLPQRQFILVGDSGEKDPEIYRFLARRFPKQVAAVLIRELPNHSLNKKRLAKFNTIPNSIFTKRFTKPEEIASVVERLQS